MANLRTNNLSGEQGQNAYRGSVLLESASSSRISVTNTTGLDFGTDQFTIEFWIYLLKEPPVNKNIFARSTSASNTTGMIMWFDGNGHLEFDSIHGVSGAVHTGAAIGNHMWHHIAVTRDSSNNTRLYLNGVNKASASSDTSNIVGATNLQIASNIGADAYYNDAYISNFRMVKGTAIYSGTTDFTPPQSELTVVDGTILLCCQDSNDPTQEATDKTVTGFGNLATAGYLGTQPKVIPPYGVDAGNAFGGPIQQSTQGYMYFPTGRTEERGRGFAVFGGGANPSVSSLIEYVHIPSGGNTITFGNLSSARNSIMAVSSQTRGIWGGGNPGTVTNIMEFVTLATSSNTTDFGDLTVARMHGGGVQNSTRGVFMTGYTPSNVNTIDFITMASTGDATDFGDVIDDGWPCGGGRSSSTRGVLMGHGDGTNRIQFITIMTTGNSQDFGDLNTNSYGVGAGELSDGLRGIAMGGSNNPSDHTNVIDFITIATTGNATEFGDLTVSRRGSGVGCTLIKGICAGGRNPSNVNTIDSVIIQTTGNATDFGDLSEARAFQPAGCSDSHGGLT